MRFFQLLAVSGIVLASYVPGNRTEHACLLLQHAYPNNTVFPGDAGYAGENEVSWSATCWLDPKCIFAPTDAYQLSAAVKIFTKLQVTFAMRGGGHMPIPEAGSIDSSGILISSSNLDTFDLSDDKSTLSVGPGLRWSDIYIKLNGTDVSVVGARLPDVGVPGFLLGGGISFYGYEYGLGSTNGNVKAYECVLANGKVIEATPTNQYADLFWALQGGGNSFCLVTRFDLRTLPAPSTTFGFPAYGLGTPDITKGFLDSVFNFASQGHKDPKSAIIPVIQWISETAVPNYSSTLFYNGNDTSPAVFDDFLGGILKPVGSSPSLSPMGLAEYSKMLEPTFKKGGASHGYNQRFHLLPALADREAMQIIHDTYFEAAQAAFNNSQGITIGLAYGPITSGFLAASNAYPGALYGLDETPALWIEQTYTWTDPAHGALIEDFIQKYNPMIKERLQSLNAMGSYYYMNEADQGQPVFETYPKDSLKKLKSIRRKYDYNQVFTKLMPGGFKVEA